MRKGNFTNTEILYDEKRSYEVVDRFYKDRNRNPMDDSAAHLKKGGEAIGGGDEVEDE